MEDIKQSEQSVEQHVDNNDKPEQPERKVKMLTEDEVNEIVRNRVNKIKEKYSDYDQLKAQLAELLEEKKKREEAELSEIDRLKKHLGEKEELVASLQKELEQLSERNRKRAIEMAFREKAREAGIEYLDDAIKLADLSQVEIDGDEIKGIDEVVKKLVEEKPFLVAKKPQQKPIGGPSNYEQDKNELKSKEEQLKAAAEKARRTGRIEDRVAYALLKRKLGL